MPWASAERVLGLGALAALASCGLLRASPGLPAAAAVAAARAAEAAEWELLRSAVKLHQERGAAALDDLRDLAAAQPESLRLRALVQDLEAAAEGRPAVAARYLEAAQEEPTAANLYLAARVAGRDAARELVRAALQQDPGLVPARVLDLGLGARAGDPGSLDRLVKLLARHPASAEGWRLLARLAPLYDRPDLARRAAETEPWCPLEPPRWPALVRAEAALRDRDPESALRLLAELPAADRGARLLEAAALTEAGRPRAARQILRDLVAEDPGDAMARFDLGLLALDYLGEPDVAAAELREFLRLVKEGASVPLNRRLQAELWLRRLEEARAAEPDRAPQRP